MKTIKRILACSMCVLLLCLCGCNREFYVHQGNSVDSYLAIDVTMHKKTWKLDESKVIPMQIGVGQDGRRYAVEDTKAVLTIYAPGCTVNGVADEWSIEYLDFFQEKYSVNYKEGFLATMFIPKYREPIEMTFPEGEHTGEVYLVLTVTYYIPSQDLTKTGDLQTVFYYTQNDSKIVFYEYQSEIEPLK